MKLEALRRYAVARTFWEPTDIVDAISRLGYLQADPIRAPARAQDLILRHRVTDYRVDDLERVYPTLPLIEDTIYNYGFFHRDTRTLLHPRRLSPRWQAFMASHMDLRRKVLRYLNRDEFGHPRAIEAHCGIGARGNGWGGQTSATTMMLEGLHVEGKLHVSHRQGGIRVYSRVRPRPDVPRLTASMRADALIKLIVNLYAPIPQKSLMPFIRGLGRQRPSADYFSQFEKMVKRGELRREAIEGLLYVWPGDESIDGDSDDRVRLLAPFDPVVWDRTRFEHLWGWPYRFEAYVPAPKRKMGYYALPMIWRDDVIGWANVAVAGKRLNVETGFVKKPPRGSATVFKSALTEEVDRLRWFLTS